MFMSDNMSNTWHFYLGTMFGTIMPWSLFLIPSLFLSWRNSKPQQPDRDKIFFIFFWISVVYILMQSAQSKLASYIFPVFPAIALLIGYYFNEVLVKKEKVLVSWFKGCAYLMAGFFGVLAVGAVIASQIYAEFIIEKTSGYVFSVCFIFFGAFIFWLMSKKEYLKVIFSTAGFIVVILATFFIGRINAEYWASCKYITDSFKKIDNSDSVILCSKFFVRGVRFYTNRKTAVIDINDHGFYSPHPIPFLNTNEKVLHFLESQNVTYAIVKDDQVEDLEKLGGDRFHVEELDNIGDKYILRIERLPKFVRQR